MVDETRIEINDSNDQALRVGATIKVWIAIAVVTLSIGSTAGIFGYVQKQDHQSIIRLEDRVGRYPDPNKVPDKDVIDTKLNNIEESLKRIEKSTTDTNRAMIRHLEGDKAQKGVK